ncbi:MAG TPA: transglutaminase family protein [Polyangiaceae bacterium]|nr:transglutaminase family protein [Polyangiaceae bacterium]
MLLSIQHKTELTYSQRISESVIELRLMPRSDAHQTLRQFHVGVGPDARVTSHRDWQDNEVHQFSVVAFHDRVAIISSATVETHPLPTDVNRMSDAIGASAGNHRLYDFLSFHGPVQRDPRVVQLAERIKLGQCARAIEAVLLVTTRTRDALDYKKGVTHAGSTVGEALDQRAGVCQDFSHLGISLLRLAGIPARYVSGYLYRSDLPEVETHAWCEAFLPSVGWVGLDPTHGELVGERHVAIAVGRSYADVPPNRGVYRGDAEEKIAVAVAIERLETPTLGAHVGVHVPTYAEAPSGGGAASGRGVEQQAHLQQQDRNKAQVQQQRQQQQ